MPFFFAKRGVWNQCQGWWWLVICCIFLCEMLLNCDKCFLKPKNTRRCAWLHMMSSCPPPSIPSTAAAPYRGRLGGRRHHPGRMGRRPSGDTWGQHPFRIDIPIFTAGLRGRSLEALRLQPLGQTTAVFFIVCLLPQENDYFPSAGVYAISEGVYLIRKTPDQLFSFNRRMCLLILGKDSLPPVTHPLQFWQMTVSKRA